MLFSPFLCMYKLSGIIAYTYKLETLYYVITSLFVSKYK